MASINLKQSVKLEQASKGRIGKLDNEYKALHKFMEGLEALIEVCGDDKHREGLQETPYRVAKAFLEYTEGYTEDPKKHLNKQFMAEGEDIVIVKDIEFTSLCEHHFAPITGVIHVGYLPTAKITGLSKIARLVDGYTRRFQNQERIGKQIADAIMEVLEAEGVFVVVDAKHHCMCGRGIRKVGSYTRTVTTRGCYTKADYPDIMNLLQ